MPQGVWPADNQPDTIQAGQLTLSGLNKDWLPVVVAGIRVQNRPFPENPLLISKNIRCLSRG